MDTPKEPVIQLQGEAAAALERIFRQMEAAQLRRDAAERDYRLARRALEGAEWSIYAEAAAQLGAELPWDTWPTVDREKLVVDFRKPEEKPDAEDGPEADDRREDPGLPRDGCGVSDEHGGAAA